MRYVCHIYEDGSIYAYETTDDGWKVLDVFEGEMPEPIKRISAFAELSADNVVYEVNPSSQMREKIV